MLHEVTAEGGVGFCQAALPGLLPWGYHGPLVAALDSNLLIDLQQHGHDLLKDEISATEEKYAEELAEPRDAGAHVDAARYPIRGDTPRTR